MDAKDFDVMDAMHRLGMHDPATMTAKGEAAYNRLRAQLVELIEAAREASATLGHIYHTTPLRSDLEQYAHDGYQRLDAAVAAFSPPKATRNCDHSWATKHVTGGFVKVCQQCGFVPPDGAITGATP